MSLDTLATHTATLKRKTKTVDSVGGIVSGSLATVTSGINGSLQPLSGGKREMFAKLSITSTDVFYTSTVIDWHVGDVLVIGSVIYEITNDADMAGRGRAFAYYLSELTV